MSHGRKLVRLPLNALQDPAIPHHVVFPGGHNVLDRDGVLASDYDERCAYLRVRRHSMYSEVTSDRIKTPSAQNNRKGGRQRGPGHQEGTQGHSPNRCCVGVSTTSSDVRKPEDGDRVLEFLTSIQWALWPLKGEYYRKPHQSKKKKRRQQQQHYRIKERYRQQQ